MTEQEYQLDTVLVDGNVYTKVVLADASRDRAKGQPDLPVIAQSIIIPDKSKMKLEIVNFDYTEKTVNAVVPSKGSLNRKFKPEDVSYAFGSAYSENAFFPQECAQIGNPYIVADYRGMVVYFHPFQYNPVTKILRVYSSITVTVLLTSETGINEKTRNESHRINSDFDQIYSRSFVNYPKHHYTAVNEEGSMMVISHADFISTVQPLVDWKNKRGVKTVLVDVATIGNTAAKIYSYISNYYSDSAANLKYVLLVGDESKVKPMTNTDWSDEYAKDGVSDNMYGMIEGNDAYMELFVGRLSGSTATQIASQVDKILYYERKYTTSDTWLNNGLTTACGTEQTDVDTISYITKLLKAYNYTTVNTYKEETDNSSVVSAVKNGVGVHINSSHGDTTLIAAMSTDDVSCMTNTNKYPFNFTLACLPGAFGGGNPCLGEALLRKDNGGFVGAYMATISQLWNEPYAAIKEHTSILCEKNASNIKRTYGGIAINGCFKMLDQYPSSGPDEIRCWELFGDPNLHVYTTTPVALTVTHPATIGTGTQNVAVSGTAGATVCLYNKKMGLQNVVTLTSGSTSLSVNISGSAGDTVYVTGTMYNHVTYEGFMIVQPATDAKNTACSTITEFDAHISGNQVLYQIPAAVANKKLDVSIQMFTPQGKVLASFTDGVKGAGKYAVTIVKAMPEFAKGTYLCSVKIGSFKKTMVIGIK